MAEHFPTFTKASRAASSGLTFAQRIRPRSERGWLRAAFYLLLTYCLACHAAYFLPSIFGMGMRGGYGYSPYGSMNSGDSFFGTVLVLLISLVGPPPFPAIVGFICLMILLFTSEKRSVPSGETVSGGFDVPIQPEPLFEEPIAVKTPPGRHPLDPDPTNEPQGHAWPKRSS